MWSVLCAPFLAAAALLAVAGMPKLGDPLPLVRALRSTGLPAGRPLVRTVALAEVLLGAAAVVAPGRLTAALVALAYLLFTAFVGLVRHRGGVLSSCGCFGRADTPATPTHLVLTATLAAAAGAVAVQPPPPGVWGTVPPVLLLTTAGYAALLAFLGYLLLAVLPTVTATAVRSAGAATSPAQRPVPAGPRNG